MQKKGMSEEMYFLLFAIVLVAGSWITMQGFVNTTVQGTFFERLYVSRDLALMADAIHAGQGNAYYNYSSRGVSMSRFLIGIEKHKVTVTDKSSNTPTFYPFAEDRGLALPGLASSKDPGEESKGFLFAPELKLTAQDKITFAKTDRMDMSSFPDTLDCGGFAPQWDKATASVLIDSVHGQAGDLDVVAAEHLKGQDWHETLPDQQVLINRLDARPRSAQSNANLAKATIILRLSFDDHGSGDSVVKAYINAKGDKFKESRAIACHVVDRLARYLGTSAAIIPKDTTGDPFLPEDKIAMTIEMGNTDDDSIKAALASKDVGGVLLGGFNDTFLVMPK